MEDNHRRNDTGNVHVFSKSNSLVKMKNYFNENSKIDYRFNETYNLNQLNKNIFHYI